MNVGMRSGRGPTSVLQKGLIGPSRVFFLVGFLLEQPLVLSTVL